MRGRLLGVTTIIVHLYLTSAANFHGVLKVPENGGVENNKTAVVDGKRFSPVLPSLDSSQTGDVKSSNRQSRQQIKTPVKASRFKNTAEFPVKPDISKAIRSLDTTSRTPVKYADKTPAKTSKSFDGIPVRNTQTGGLKSEATGTRDSLNVSDSTTPVEVVRSNLVQSPAPEVQGRDARLSITRGRRVGDMMLRTSSEHRHAVSDISLLWPEGVVFLRIHPAFNFVELNTILMAVEDFHLHTCIRFVPYTGVEPNWVDIHPGPSNECWSWIGKHWAWGPQEIELGCVFQKGTVIHELMHAIGFHHEHNRADRDDHVTILWTNLVPGKMDEYQIIRPSVANIMGSPYDYSSVMHYSALSHTRNGLPTMLPLRRGARLGAAANGYDGFSPLDIIKINRLYNC